MKLNLLIGAFGLLSLFSCGGSSSGGPGSRVETRSAPLSAGVYEVSCFYNFQASQDDPVYTTAKLSLNADHTGVNEVGLFSESDCSDVGQELTIAILDWEEQTLGAHSVIRMVQDNGGGSEYEYWIPHTVQNGILYFNLGGASNSTSGPYGSFPDEAVMSAFEASPATLGVEVRR